MSKNKYNGITAVGDKWRVQLFRKGKNFYLGEFDNDLAAARIADETGLLTQAWANRKVQLNFNGSKSPDEGALLPAQKAMLEYLRLNFPQDERDYVKLVDAELYVPDVLLEHFDVVIRRQEESVGFLRQTLSAGRSSLIRASADLREKDKIIEWQRTKIADLEERIRGKEFVEKASQRPGGLFRRVGGPDDVPSDRPPSGVRGIDFPFPPEMIAMENTGREALCLPLIGVDGFEIKPEPVVEAPAVQV